MNRVMLVGNLCADAEVRDIKGTPKCRLNVAVTRKWDGGSKTTFVPVVTWGAPATWCAPYKKGQKICVEGSLEIEKYQDKNGVDKTDTYIRAENIYPIAFIKREEVSKEIVEDNTDIPF